MGGATKHSKRTKEPGKGRDSPRPNPPIGPFELRKPEEILFAPSDSRPFASFVGPTSESFRLSRPGSVGQGTHPIRQFVRGIPGSGD
jgi:hypothetical protein